MDEILRGWDISEDTIEAFRNHNIDISCLDGLEEEELKILIPDSKLRDRIKFKTGYKKYKYDILAVHSNTDSLETLSCDSLESVVFSDVSSEEKSSILNKDIDLHKILSDNIYGCRAIQALNQKKLDTSSRNNLVKGIIEYYLKKKVKLTKNDFEAIANEVVRVCPNECKETYYIASRSLGSKTYLPAKGKLIDRYYNQQRILQQSGIVPKKRRSSTPKYDTFENEADDDSHIWLKYNRDPWPSVEKKWRETCTQRKKIYYDSNRNLTDVFNEWPCLKCANGYRLIEIDFQFAYPDKDLILYEKWTSFINKCSEIFKRDLAENDLLQYLNEDCNDTKAFIVLTLMAHKIKPTSKVLDAEKKKYIKISVAESQQAFLLFVQNYSDIEEALNSRRRCYNRKGLTCQPIIVCVGTIKQFESFYVVIDDIKYCFQSLAKAVDICFKSFMVLNLSYPTECEQLWIFIQQFVFEISLNVDKIFSNVSTFIKELEK